MTIFVQRIDGGTLQVRDGHMRLRVALSTLGYANVTDVETDEQFMVHEVDGQIVVLAEPGAAAAETIAAAAIERLAKVERKTNSLTPLSGSKANEPWYRKFGARK